MAQQKNVGIYTDNRLATQSNAKEKRTKKTMTPEEAKKILEEEIKRAGAK